MSIQHSEVPIFTEDSRLRFFLEHQDAIRQWAALEKEVRDALVTFLEGLWADVNARLTGLDPDALVTRAVHGERNVAATVFRSSWRAGGGDPFVGVALGWDRTVWPTGSSPPYVGVLTSHFDDAGRGLEKPLRDAFKGWAMKSNGFQLGSYWIVYRGVRASHDWWRDINEWRGELITNVEQAWALLAPTVDAVLAGRAVGGNSAATL